LRVAVNAEQLLYRSPGGIGRYTAQLLTLLPAAHPDCEVVPVVGRHTEAEVQAALSAFGVSEAVRRRAAGQALPAALMYEAWVRLGWPPLRGVDGATLVHAPSAAVPPASGRPLVVTVHDAAPELFPEGFTARGRRFHRLGMAAAARRAEVVITVSQSAADEIAAHTPIGADRIVVVPNGVDPPAADPAADAEARARLGLAGRRYLFWVGSLEPRKGVGTLVAAAAELKRSGAHPDLLTVVGGYAGWLNDHLIAPADRAALGDSLVEAGRLSEADLWALYRGAAIFAFPSHHEGFGLPVLEAMSQGTPVVASDIPAIREVAGDAALLVPPGNVAAWAGALDGLLADETGRARLGGAGPRRAARFTAAATMAATHAVYQTVGSSG